MKIKVEIPDTAMCAIVTYVFAESTGYSIGTKILDTYDIKDCERREKINGASKEGEGE